MFDGVFLASLIDRKEEVFGVALAKHVEPIEFTRGRLTVKVDSDARRQVVFDMRNVVLERLDEFSPGAVKRIFFV
ncbi:MAG: DUF721 domain-containing protein [bacterium]|nr:DUF721 domain-containing protein [bacterium]